MVGYNGSLHYPNNESQGCNNACIGTLSLQGSQVSIVVFNLGILYDLECYEVLNMVVTSPMSLENVA